MNTLNKLKLSTCLLGASLLFPVASFAQQDHGGDDHGGQHTMSQQGSGRSQGSSMGQAGMDQGEHGGEHEQMMRRMEQMQQRMRGQNSQSGGTSVFTQIQNQVRTLQEDPNTDWTQVDLNALHQHLVDMEHLSLFAEVSTQYLANGLRYTVSGEGRTREAIQRMLPMHASQIAEELGIQAKAELTSDGAWISVETSDDGERAMYQAIGFLGLMTLGEHHDAHHQDMAGSDAGHSGHSGH